MLVVVSVLDLYIDLRFHCVVWLVGRWGGGIGRKGNWEKARKGSKEENELNGDA